jgi:hypothetical protein
MLHNPTSGTNSERASSGLYEYHAHARWTPAGSGDSYRKCLRRFACRAAVPQFYLIYPLPPLDTWEFLNTIAPM